MKALEARLAALESQLGASDADFVLVRITRFGERVEEEDQRIIGAGREWLRQPGETEDAFVDRARREAGRAVRMLVITNRAPEEA